MDSQRGFNVLSLWSFSSLAAGESLMLGLGGTSNSVGTDGGGNYRDRLQIRYTANLAGTSFLNFELQSRQDGVFTRNALASRSLASLPVDLSQVDYLLLQLEREAPTAGNAVMFAYLGLAGGDFASGFLSQFIGSRRRVVLLFQALTLAFVAAYFFLAPFSLTAFYALCVALGFGVGYWAVFVTIASEQFGTNIRATATTTVPNFVRGAVVPLTLGFQALTPRVGVEMSGIICGAIALALAFLGLSALEETYGKDLDFVED